MRDIVKNATYTISKLDREEIDLYTELFGPHRFAYMVYNNERLEEQIMAKSLREAKRRAVRRYGYAQG